jgi:ABC-type phosphate transport system substrate-binding protein
MGMHPTRLARALPALALLAAACAGEAPLRIKGSDTELNLMARVAEALHRVDPRQVLSVSGGGRGWGLPRSSMATPRWPRRPAP